MAKNRVERLESTVEELESTIEGLTEELVEAKERIRVLEAELDTQTPTRVPARRTNGADEAPEPETPADDDVEEAVGEAEDSGSDDIIVA